MTTVAKAQADIATAIASIRELMDGLKGDHSNPAICAGIDLGHCVRELERASNFLTRNQERGVLQ